jgi:AraC-like DNA-binding protein
VSICLADASGQARPRHAPDSLTVGVVTAGRRRMETRRHVAEVATGEVFAVPPGVAHACEPADGPCSSIAVSIEARRLPPGFPPDLPLRLADAELADALLRLAEAVQAPSGALERQSLLAEVLERLAGHGRASNDAQTAEDAEAEPDGVAQAVARARAMLEADAQPGLDLPALAEACGAAPLPLHRAFTRLVGLPPHAFQTHVRLRRAKELLRAGASLIDAAHEAGFCDQSHMNRHFARLVGLTPAQYARAHAGR